MHTIHLTKAVTSKISKELLEQNEGLKNNYVPKMTQMPIDTIICSLSHHQGNANQVSVRYHLTVKKMSHIRNKNIDWSSSFGKQYRNF